MTVFREERAAEHPRRNRRIVMAVAGVAVLLAILLLWRDCHKAAADEDKANVVVSVQMARAERGTMVNELTISATLAAKREATIMPKISAQIAKMDLLKNRIVRAGDVLAILEARDLEAQRAEAAAAVQEADATAHATVQGNIPLTNAQDRKSVRDARAAEENARKTFERRQTLFAQGGISKKELEASQLALTNAEDDLRLAETSSNLHGDITNPGDIVVAQAKARQAQQHLASLEAQAGYTVVRAPFDGTITDQFQYQGDFAAPATKLLTIADASSLIARMQVGETTATLLKQGDKVQLIADDLPNERIAGTITLVGRAADPQSRSVEVWVEVPNPGGRLRANGVARVIIDAQSTPNAVIVPSAAVTLNATNGDSGTVMVVDAKSVAHEVHVTTGIRSNGKTQIIAGLNGGETVVTEGNYGLPDGTKVAAPAANTGVEKTVEPAEQ